MIWSESDFKCVCLCSMLRTKVVDSFSFNFHFHSVLISSCQDVSVQVCCKTSLEKFNTFLFLSSYFSIYRSPYLYFFSLSLSFSPYSISLSSKISICICSVSLFQYSNYLCNSLSVRISTYPSLSFSSVILFLFLCLYFSLSCSFAIDLSGFFSLCL